MTNRFFTSWVRRGAAGAITQVDPLSGPYAGPATFNPHVVLAKDSAPQPPVMGPAVTLLGPGAVESINVRQIVRTDPAADATAVEDNYLVLAELARPDFPWLFTPAAPTGQGRLRPWIVLVVVEAAGVVVQPGRPLPRITVSDAELPDLNDSWAWAHVQSTVDSGSPDAAAAALAPESGGGAVARLLCPRRLRADTAYLACLAPSTRAGVQAGLGLPQDPGSALAMAWNAGAGLDVVLPVYYSWTFATGSDGDFKSLVQRLQGVAPDSIPGFGSRTIDVSSPWTSPPQLDPGLTVQMDGALGLGPRAGDALPDPARTAFETRMTRLINFPADRQPRSDPNQPGFDPSLSAVAPPLYGGRHAGQVRAPAPPGWLVDLNLDPRRRIAAAFGTRYVQEHQEFLAARAWDQVGAVREANRLKDQGELAAEVADRLHARHVLNMAPSQRVAFAGPARARVLTSPATTLKADTAATAVPAGAATTAYNRLTRPLGPIGRRAFNGQAPATIAKGLENTLTIHGPALQLDGIADLKQGPTQAGADATERMVVRAWASLSATEQSVPAPGDLTQLLQALKPGAAGGGPLMKSTPVLMPAYPRTVQVTTASISDTVGAALQPGAQILKRLGGRVKIPARLGGGQATGAVMACPQFTAPLALALLREHPEYLLPGLGNFPDDRVTLLIANGAFVEAFLAGANHEMNRELLWRGYPTDQRGTPFQRFWPRPDGTPDIPPITAWPLATPLGANGAALGPDIETMVVLLVRGEVLRRYPRTIVYAAPGMINGDKLALNMAAQWTPPLFLLPLDAETTVFAFNLSPADVHSNIAAGKAGSYFVFSEPVTGPRFRFGAGAAGPPQIWADLAWDSVPSARGFAIAGEDLAPPAQENAPDSARWNRDAADIARIAFARPFRIAYHADELLARPANG